MPHDPELIAETRVWLAKSANDLGIAEALSRNDPPFLDDVVFHCQQAAEKALKGFLAWHKTGFRKTHNLEEIGEQCLKLDPTLKDLIDRATPLTEYAWKFRYPGEPEAPSREEAEEALATARQVYQAVLARLPQELRP
jgi:HEPN domain-containing protein